MGGVAVFAAGGNSLIKDDRHKSIPNQYLAAVETCKHIGAMVEQGWEIVLTHGNGLGANGGCEYCSNVDPSRTEKYHPALDIY